MAFSSDALASSPSSVDPPLCNTLKFGWQTVTNMGCCLALMVASRHCNVPRFNRLKFVKSSATASPGRGHVGLGYSGALRLPVKKTGNTEVPAYTTLTGFPSTIS